jgi:diguanylate cyclase (GGDEF)-like protein
MVNMEYTLNNKWTTVLEIVDVAFQPILNIHTAKLYGVEALLRNFEDAGFKSIFGLFDAAYQDGVLYPFDIGLREKAFQKFIQLKNFASLRLFYNLDNRLFHTEGTFDFEHLMQGNTKALLQKYNIKQDSICFELSERQEITNTSSRDLETVIQHYKEEEFDVAIDDFGIGHSGYKLLYELTPDIIKIDRFFLTDIDKNLKKQIMVKNIIYLAILLGIKVVAEGVENEEELRVCRDLGCHLVQGYFIQRPTQEVDEITIIYKHIAKIVARERRLNNLSSKIKKYLERSQAFSIASKMKTVIEHFRANPDMIILPIVNLQKEPVGVLLEKDIKDFLYSPYGISILLNEGSNKSKIKNIMTPCVSADINSPLSTIIDLYSNNPKSVGIIITKNAKYFGFLSARAIITIINENNVLMAREQNPLTKLPGNRKIEEYMHDVVQSDGNYLLCYFDLDNFKAYNDVYGFRNGDRVIILFAELLQKQFFGKFFIGHIGGDDFFVATQYENDKKLKLLESLGNMLLHFENDVKSFYTAEDRERGAILAKDREGREKKFGLLSASASVLFVSKASKERSIETINAVLSKQKKIAKCSNDHFCISCLL